MLSQKPSAWLMLMLSMALYYLMGYEIPRHESLPLLACYFSAFVLFLLIVRQHHRMVEEQLRFWLVASLVFRVMLVFSVPSLSDDFYRFIWDGRLLDAGYHPFAQVPSWYMTHPSTLPGAPELFSNLNSKETFTIYPPVAQFIFWISVKLSPGSVYGSVVVMKSIILLFEIATLWIMRKVFLRFSIPDGNLLLYSLNPLVILELTGNLHFEGVMVFFLLLSIFLLSRQALMLSALGYALSICTKLVPLLFLPLLVRHLGWKKSMTYWVATGVFTALLFLPFLDTRIIQGLSTSLGYYFHRFEFNASLYYLIRAAGYLVFGFNIIQFSGPLLALAATATILYVAFRKLPLVFPGAIDRRLFTTMLWCMLAYLISATILHPWYIITLLAISLLTRYRFPLVWTAVIFLSYAGYTANGFEENLFLVVVEYAAVIAYLLYETVWKKPANRS